MENDHSQFTVTRHEFSLRPSRCRHFGRRSRSALSLLALSSPHLCYNPMATDPNLYDVKSSDHFKDLLSKDLQRVSLLYFWAPWAEPCKQMTEVVDELSKKYPTLLSLKIEAEEQSEISESFDIESVPTSIILRVRRISFSGIGPLRSIFLSSTLGPHFARSHSWRRCLRPYQSHWNAHGLCGVHHTTFPFRQITRGPPSRGESGDARGAQ